VFVVLALTFQRQYLCPTCFSQSRWPVSLRTHERRVDEHDSIAVCGCAVHPGDGLLDASLPGSVQNPPVCVDDRHAGLVSH
jgi:hypothetical protein